MTAIERDLEYRGRVQTRFTARTSLQRELSLLDATRDRARSSESLSRFRIFTTSSGGKSSMGVKMREEERDDARREVFIVKTSHVWVRARTCGILKVHNTL